MSYLELTNIQKRFGETVAVESFNLAAEKGEFVSFLGPSGCGKTTTLRMIAGFEQPTAGTIHDQRRGHHLPTAEPAQRRHGLPVVRAVPEHDGGRQHRLRAQGPQAAAATRSRSASASCSSSINLPDKGARYPYQLSGGQQQRVALARALAFEPQVLLLDEPLSALDAKIRVALRHEIRQIQRQLGITTVYVTHDQEEALSLSDRVVVMSEGRMEQVGTPFEIYNFPTTAFVASFVGTLNVLPGVVVDAGARRARRSPARPIRIARRLRGQPRAARSASRCGRRWSRWRRRPDGWNRLTGKVTDVSFLGSIVRIRVRLGLGRRRRRGAATGRSSCSTSSTSPTLKLPAARRHGRRSASRRTGRWCSTRRRRSSRSRS